MALGWHLDGTWMALGGAGMALGGIREHLKGTWKHYSDSDMAGNAEPGNKRRSQMGMCQRMVTLQLDGVQKSVQSCLTQPLRVYLLEV